MPNNGIKVNMRNQSALSHQIKVGDTVAYRLRTGESVHTVRGKVTALYNTQCGILADIEWEWIGPPNRVDVLNLAKV